MSAKKESDEKRLEKLEKDRLKCIQCTAWCRPQKLNLEGYEVQGWKCPACGYEILSPRDFEKAYLFLKAKKEKEIKISKRGNSFMITIPKQIISTLELTKKATARVYLQDARTIIVKVG